MPMRLAYFIVGGGCIVNPLYRPLSLYVLCSMHIILPPCIAACSLGAAWASIDQTTAHLKERVAFGRPLSKFQVSLASILTESNTHHV